MFLKDDVAPFREHITVTSVEGTERSPNHVGKVSFCVFGDPLVRQPCSLSVCVTDFE